MLNEAIVDTLRKYWKKGLLTTAVMASLLANNVNAADLRSAGVPQNQIELAQQNVGGDEGDETQQQFIPGKNYIIDGQRYRFLGYDEDGSLKFQGVKMPGSRRVKKAPQYDTSKGKVTQRKFYR